ncbi:hypothetical protein H7I76_23275 [Mycolicibacterium vaccae]|nr:hypothetical protein [Mycolicibacterium vaccae]
MLKKPPLYPNTGRTALTPTSCQAASSQAKTNTPSVGNCRSRRILAMMNQNRPTPRTRQPISQNRIQAIVEPGISSGPFGDGVKASEKIQRRYT